jgi:hypothetical protein
MATLEIGDPEANDPRPPLCAPQNLLVGVMPGVRALGHPTFSGL